MQHPVPKLISCCPTEAAPFEAPVRAIDTGGIFVAARPEQLSYGDSVRVTFRTGVEPALVMEGRVIAVVRDKGARIEPSRDMGDVIFTALGAWSEGRPAEIEAQAPPLFRRSSRAEVPRPVSVNPTAPASAVSPTAPASAVNPTAPASAALPTVPPATAAWAGEPSASTAVDAPRPSPSWGPHPSPREMSSPEPRTGSPRRRNRRLEGMRVFLVDDDPATLRALQRLIGLEGAEVLTTSDPTIVAPTLSERAIDVVILDWMLPKLPGAEVLAKVREAWPSLPVLVISGALWWDNAATDILKMGANRVLPKPVDLSELIGWLEAKRPLAARGETAS